MQNVAEYVARNPGSTPLKVAYWLTTRNGHTSRRYGYAIVHRAVAAGLCLMVERKDKAGCYRLYPIASA